MKRSERTTKKKRQKKSKLFIFMKKVCIGFSHLLYTVRSFYMAGAT